MLRNQQLVEDKISKSENNRKPAFKIILIGNAGVGKTSILQMYLNKQYIPDQLSTIGVEFSSKDIEISKNTHIKLQIWDTAGQESFRSIIKTFYRNAQAVMFVYNITDLKSFKDLDQWYEESMEMSNREAIKILVGAQKDRESEREVQIEDAQQFKYKLNCDLFYETSAKEGINIEEAFQGAANILFDRYMMQKGKQMEENLYQKEILIYNSSKQKNEENKSDCC